LAHASPTGSMVVKPAPRGKLAANLAY